VIRSVRIEFANLRNENCSACPSTPAPSSIDVSPMVRRRPIFSNSSFCSQQSNNPTLRKCFEFRRSDDPTLFGSPLSTLPKYFPLVTTLRLLWSKIGPAKKNGNDALIVSFSFPSSHSLSRFKSMSSPLVLGPILPGDWPVSSTDPSYTGYKQAIINSASTLLDSIQQSEDGSSSAGFNKSE